MWKAFEEILNAIFPKKEEVLRLEALARAGRLRDLPPALDPPKPWMRAVFHYKNNSVRALIWEIKYAGNTVLTEEAGKILCEEIFSFLDERGAFVGSQWYIVPIPPSKEHLKEKGFNQTEMLCKEILKASGNTLSILPGSLKKIRETIPQAKIKNRSERLRNLVDAFESDEAIVTGKNIILIDDVTTTGSTFIEARRALRAAGAKHVIAIALGH